jgi:hypothetical protein
MISLDDDQVLIVMRAARQLPPAERDAFPRGVARELRIGDADVDRVVREVLKRTLARPAA